LPLCFLALLAILPGCRTGRYTGPGTLLGGLAGAGVGALIGHKTGDTAAGALIGTGVGAATGAVVGNTLDDIEARNRAQIATQLGRPVAQGAATTTEVLEMTRAGVDPQLIVNYVNSAGMIQPLTVQDVIYLHEQGVRTEVIQAMQSPRVAQLPPTSIAPPSQTVIIHEDPYWPYCEPHYHFSFGHHCCH
jgi:hypothetical protein